VSLEALKRWRLIVPGMLIVAAFPPLFHAGFDAASWLEGVGSTKALADAAGVVILGVLYYIFGIRDRFWRKWLSQVNEQIRNTLLGMCPDKQIQAKTDKLRSDRTLMHMFYRFIDIDPTLQEKAKRVRFNGLIWTSVIDAWAISLFGSAAYLATYLLVDRIHLALIGLGLVAASGFCRSILIPRLTKQHLDLSKEQLEFIELHYRQDVCSELRRIASGR